MVDNYTKYQIRKMLETKIPQWKIAEITGVSLATVSRVKNSGELTLCQSDSECESELVKVKRELVEARKKIFELEKRLYKYEGNRG